MPLNSELKKIQRLFKALHRNSRTFQGLHPKFKDFSRLCEPWIIIRRTQHIILVLVFRSMPFKSSWNFVETHNKDQVTFVPWEVYPCVWVYLHICSLTSFMHEKVSLSVSVQVVTTVMLYSRLIYLRGPFCMISISLAEAS